MKKKKAGSVEIILIIGILSILIAPWIITRSLGLVVFDDSTGTIGDTIGGITAPITGLIGSFLVYQALKAQIEANRLIAEQFERQKDDEKNEKIEEEILINIRFVREDINEFSIVGSSNFAKLEGYSSGKTAATYKGVDAIRYVLHSHSDSNKHSEDLSVHMPQILNIMDRIIRLLGQTGVTSGLKNRLYLRINVGSTYLRIYWILRHYESHLPKQIIEKFNYINKELALYKEHDEF